MPGIPPPVPQSARQSVNGVLTKARTIPAWQEPMMSVTREQAEVHWTAPRRVCEFRRLPHPVGNKEVNSAKPWHSTAAVISSRLRIIMHSILAQARILLTLFGSKAHKRPYLTSGRRLSLNGRQRVTRQAMKLLCTTVPTMHVGVVVLSLPIPTILLTARLTWQMVIGIIWC